MSENNTAEGTETETGGATESQGETKIWLPEDHPLVKKLAIQKAEITDLKGKAARLAEIEDIQKPESESEKDEGASVPSKVAEALKAHLVTLHGIADEDAELFLTATEPELMLKQIDRLLSQSGKRRKNSNYVPDQGNKTNNAETTSDMREFTRQLFGSDS